MKFQKILRDSPDPETATIRFEQLYELAEIKKQFDKMSEEDIGTLIRLIAISNFIYRYLYRWPDKLSTLLNGKRPADSSLDAITTTDVLKEYKYQQLIKICWLDIEAKTPYPEILQQLSVLAQQIIVKGLELTNSNQTQNVNLPFCVFAMGKLGANELNLSSDVDLIFVMNESEDDAGDLHQYQASIYDHIRKFNQFMQQESDDGFLYRVDLNLRPLGRSGPLALSIDETEHYYEASNEAWERFAWLRARVIAGDINLGEDLLRRIEPFIYLRSLSSDDLRRFVEIKQMMARQRRREGNWNIKLGEGGIRDIEFFIQMLQLVNAATHPALKITHTLSVMQCLIDGGFIDSQEGEAIRDSYLFLRKLENRLQMIDERQTHQLPDDPANRIKIAASMGFGASQDARTLDNFNEKLMQCQSVASHCFDKILPGKT